MYYPRFALSIIFIASLATSASAARLLHIEVSVAPPGENEQLCLSGIATDGGRQQGAALIEELKTARLERSEASVKQFKSNDGEAAKITQHAIIRIKHTDKNLVTLRPETLRLLPTEDGNEWLVDPRDVARMVREFEE